MVTLKAPNAPFCSKDDNAYEGNLNGIIKANRKKEMQEKQLAEGSKHDEKD